MDRPDEIAALRELVLLLYTAESADLEHGQFIFRSGPQDWDAEPMTDEQHDLLLSVLEDTDG